ncbi:MAG: DsrE/DsrF/TusD sulfur relay family protein [Bacillota bacterium]
MSDEKGTLTLFLTATPFGSESPVTALNLAEAALDRGYQVNLFLSADAVYGASAGQKAVGLPPVGERLEGLMAKGLRVDLCGSCLQLRGLRKDARIEGPQPSSLKNLFGMMEQSRAFIALGR